MIDRHFRSLKFASLLLASLIAAVAPVNAQDDRTFVDLMVNAQSRGETVIILRLPDILIEPSDLEAAGLTGFTGMRSVVGAKTYVSLKSLEPALTFAFDDKHLILTLMATVAHLENRAVVDLAPQPAANVDYRSHSNAFMNYVLNRSVANGHWNGSFETGLNTKSTQFYNTVFLRGRTLSRGLSYLERDNRKAVRRSFVGDAFIDTGDGGASLLLGGFMVERQFDLDPYSVRFPTPSLRGSVLTPSTADVYINGVLTRTITLEPGQFDLRNLPVANGVNDNVVVIRDAFGRAQGIQSEYYGSTGLLRRGLTDYAYAAGLQRETPFSSADRYANAVLAGRYRVGLNDSLTAGGRLELSGNTASAGLVMDTRSRRGFLHLTGSISRDHGLRGGAFSLAYSFAGQHRATSASFTLQTPHYTNLSLHAGDDRLLVDAQISSGFAVSRKAAVALSLGHVYDRDQGARNRAAIQTSIQLPHELTLDFVGTHSNGKFGRSNSILVTMSVPLGTRDFASTSLNESSSGIESTLQFQRNPPAGTGLGYTARVSRGAFQENGGVVRYQTSVGNVELSSGRGFAGQGGSTVSFAGGIAAIGHRLYFSRPLSDGFALVQIPDMRGVPVYVANQEIGQTDRRGNLLVTGLLPNYGNHIRISDIATPLNVRITSPHDQVVGPGRLRGAIVRFEVRKLQAVVGKIHVRLGTANLLPSYGELVVHTSTGEIRSDLGSDGQFYFELLPPGNYDAKVVFREGACDFRLRVPPSSDVQTNLKVVPCIK